MSTEQEGSMVLMPHEDFTVSFRASRRRRTRNLDDLQDDLQDDATEVAFQIRALLDTTGGLRGTS